MKNILIPALLFASLLGCDREEAGNLEYAGNYEGGCFLEKSSTSKNDPYFKPDTVTYSIVGDNLEIFVGFNATCCSEFISSASINGDSILINIETTQPGMCNCICYYSYNFRFSGDANLYMYRVRIDDFQDFSGVIKR